VKSEEARVHFIPNLKDGVFVTLCAPAVINIFSNMPEDVKDHIITELKNEFKELKTNNEGSQR